MVISSQKCGHHTAPVDDKLVCNDPGCETLVSDVNLLRYDSTGCDLVVSLFQVYSLLLSNLL
ncbi:hypothetical protein L208DRAFT_1386063 [Tricholoma matsutake]|nr:hypothetical protein L208DRAFT_1386063 [Tricholoma matsutake 945]